jgi:hypothetical protein
MKGMRILATLAYFGLLASSGEAAMNPACHDRPYRLLKKGHDPDHFSLNANCSIATATQATGAISSLGTLPPMNGSEKFRYYIRSTYGAKSILSSAVGSGMRHAKDYVPEWGQGMEGYGKRFASSFGQKVVKDSVHISIEAFLHEDPRYFASNRIGIWRRTLYAAGQTFISHRDSGGIRPGYSHFIGIACGVYVSRHWYPEGHRTTGRYICAGAISIGLDVVNNIFNEFWPDMKRMIRH